jgi:FSR family fosmidomycin resistance protein-like MFS transporter
MDRKKVYLVGSMHFFLDAYMGFFAIYQVIAGLDPVKSALIITVSSFAGNALQPFMGYAADRVRGKVPLFAGLILAPLFMSAIGFTKNYALLVVFVLLGHVGSSIFHPAGANVAGAAGARRKQASFALFTTIGTFGYALSQLVFSAFTHRFGTNRSLLLAVPGVALGMLYLFFSRTEVHGHHEHVPLRELWQLLLKRSLPILLLFLIMVFRTVFVGSVNFFLAKILEEWGFSRNVYSSAQTVFMFSAAGGILLEGQIAHWLKPRWLLFYPMVAFFPFFILFLVFGLSGRLLLCFVFLALTGFVLHGGYGTNIVMGQKIAPEMTSTISGILMGFAWAAASFGPTLTALTRGAVPAFGNLSSGLFIVSLFPLAASALALLLSKEVGG